MAVRDVLRSMGWPFFAVFVILLLIGLGLVLADVPDALSAGPFALGYLTAGGLSIGAFAVGTFAVGVFAAGIFAIGIFSIGVFSIGIFCVGIWIAGPIAHPVWTRTQNRLRSAHKETRGEPRS